MIGDLWRHIGERHWTVSVAVAARSRCCCREAPEGTPD